MDDRNPRPSTDQETAPLLRDAETDDGASEEAQPSFKDRVTNTINEIVQEPLTPLSKTLLVIAILFLLLTSIFIGLFAGSQHKLNEERGKHESPLPQPTTIVSTTTAAGTTTLAPPPGPTSPPVEQCLSKECVILAASILSSLDTSVDPCEDFYDFANGGWLKEHPVPADKASYGNFEALAQQNKVVLKNILESDVVPSFATSWDKQLLGKLRGLYSSCTNETRLDEREDKPLQDFVGTLRKLFRGNSTDIGPMGSGTKSEGLTAALAFLHSHGIDALFSFVVEGDAGVDPNNLILWFYQPSLGLPSKEYYSEESITDMYRGVIEKLQFILAPAETESQDDVVLPHFVVNDDSDHAWPPWPWPPWGGDDDEDDGKEPINQTERAYKLAKAVVEFETKIANATLDLDVMQQDPFATYHPVRLDNISLSLPSVNFPVYFSSFTPRTFPDRIILTHPPYAAALGDILNSTSSDVVEAYLVTRAALSLAPYLGMSTDAWLAQRSLVETLQGIKKGAVGDRGEYCVQQVEETMGFAAGRYFVNETFGGDSKEKATKVITDIVDAFVDSLKRIDWMDEKSAKAAAEKAEAIRVKVGYPISPDTKDALSLVRYYSPVKINEESFFENILSSGKLAVYHQWITLGRRRDAETWEMYPSMVNAYFNPPANEIVFPAGILQPPFFSASWPSYLSYGAFGQVASHELTHAFDSAGRLYNQNGKLEEWWTNATSAAFNELQKCIVDQYSEYTIDDGKGGKVHVNGNLTSGENIGDSGIIQAYRAWKHQFHTSVQKGNEFLLPGLGQYSREQLFFIAFGRIWARDMKPAAAVQRIRTDPHSPTKYRVEGTLSNVPEFAEAFKCKKGSKLNPPSEKQCKFWG